MGVKKKKKKRMAGDRARGIFKTSLFGRSTFRHKPLRPMEKHKQDFSAQGLVKVNGNILIMLSANLLPAVKCSLPTL